MVSPNEPVVVYRSTDPVALDLVEDMLRVEGLSPQRLGRANPALLGAGAYAIEQLIAVPDRHADEARALIEARGAGPRPEDVADLEQQALRARPEFANQAPEGVHVDLRFLVLTGLVALLFALLSQR